MGCILSNQDASTAIPAHRVAIAQFIEHTSGVKPDKRRRLRSWFIRFIKYTASTSKFRFLKAEVLSVMSANWPLHLLCYFSIRKYDGSLLYSSIRATLTTPCQRSYNVFFFTLTSTESTKQTLDR